MEVVEVDEEAHDLSDEDDVDTSSNSSQRNDSPTKVPPFQPHKPPAQPVPEPVDDLSSALQKTREEDRKKGKAVSRQLVHLSFIFVVYFLTLAFPHQFY